MDLKNIKLEDIKQKILTFADKKTLIKFGVGLGSILVFLIIYYAILNPIVKKQKLRLEDMITKKVEIKKFKKEIKKSKSQIKKIKPTYEKSSTLFHSKEEVEGLYDSLSKYAEVNGLVISGIKKKKPIAVIKGKKGKKGKSKKTKNLKKVQISYYKIPVEYEIKGNFLGYLKFKRSLAKSGKMLNFDKEKIKVVSKDASGAIVAKGLLTIVGMTDEFF